MTIPRSDVWIVRKDDNRAVQTATALAHDGDAPPEFEDVDAVKDYIRQRYDVGTYQILLPEASVEIEPKREMYANYTDEDIEAVSAAAELLGDRDDTTMVRIIDDPTANDGHANIKGAYVRLDPLDYDVEIKALLNDRSPHEVAEELAETAEGLRLIGWKPTTYHARRGARGQSAIKAIFSRDVQPLSNVTSVTDNHDNVLAVLPADAISHIPIAVNDSLEEGIDAVVVTDHALQIDEPLEPTDEDGERVVQAYDEHATDLGDAIDDEADRWEVTSIGGVLAADADKDALLTLGLTLAEGEW